MEYVTKGARGSDRESVFNLGGGGRIPCVQLSELCYYITWLVHC